jgi:hypothetical protein
MDVRAPQHLQLLQRAGAGAARGPRTCFWRAPSLQLEPWHQGRLVLRGAARLLAGPPPRLLRNVCCAGCVRRRPISPAAASHPPPSCARPLPCRWAGGAAVVLPPRPGPLGPHCILPRLGPAGSRCRAGQECPGGAGPPQPPSAASSTRPSRPRPSSGCAPLLSSPYTARYRAHYTPRAPVTSGRPSGKRALHAAGRAALVAGAAACVRCAALRCERASAAGMHAFQVPSTDANALPPLARPRRRLATHLTTAAAAAAAAPCRAPLQLTGGAE